MSLKALIAEADFLELELIGTVLARDGFVVERASDGAAAIERLEAMGGADLVVCTYALPGKSGADVCAAVKKARPETRFVLLHPSGNDVDVCAVILSRVGCDAVLATPFRYDALKSLLVEWDMRPTKPPAAAVVPISFAVPPPDVSELLSAVADEPDAPVAEDADTESSADAEAEADAERAAAEAEVAASSDEPLPVVFPPIESPVLAEFEGAETPEVPRELPELAEYAPEGAAARVEGGDAAADAVEGTASSESVETFEAAASTERTGAIEAYEATAPYEATASTEPTGPIEATAPREPTERFEAVAPTAPFEATEPTEPFEATAATAPFEATESTEPTESFEAIAPTEPFEATEPTEPTEPIETTAPTEPTEPFEATAATAPFEATDPTDPTDPFEPTEPTQPYDPTASTEPFAAFEASSPIDPTAGPSPAIPVSSLVEPTDPFHSPHPPETSVDWSNELSGSFSLGLLDEQSSTSSPATDDALPPPPPVTLDGTNANASGEAEWRQGPPPPPGAPMDDEPTVNMREPQAGDTPSFNEQQSAEQARVAARAMEEAAAAVAQAAASVMDDEPTVIPGSAPTLPDAKADDPFAGFGEEPRDELADASVSTKWLATPPGEHVSDGFEAVDFGSIDSELDAAFGETPTARVEAQDATSIGLQDSESAPPLPVEAPLPPLPPVEDMPVTLAAPEPDLSALASSAAADAVTPPPPMESAAAEQPPAPPPDDEPPSRGVRPLIPPPVGERSTRAAISSSGAREWNASSQAAATTDTPRIVFAPALVQQPPPPPAPEPVAPLAVAAEHASPPPSPTAEAASPPPVPALLASPPPAPARDHVVPPPAPARDHASPHASASAHAPPPPPFAPASAVPPPPPVAAAVSQVSPEKKAVSTRGASEWAPKPSAEAVSPSTKVEARGLVQPPPTPTETLVSVSPSPPAGGVNAAPAAPPAAPAGGPVFASAPPPAPVGARSWRPAPSAPPPPSRSGPKTIDMSIKTESAPASPSAPPPAPHEAFAEPPPPPLAASTQVKTAKTEPRTSLPPSLPPVGDLATTPLPRLLFELYGATFCGALKLHRKDSDRVISIWNGIPVAMHVTPEPLGDDLASLLREHGRITPEQHEDAERRAPKREAQLLVALGVIDERDLLDVIREQTELRLAASFAWRDGTYVITPSKEPPDSVVLSEVHPIKVIWRGVSEHYDAASLLQFFSTLRNRYIVATEVFPVHYERLGPFLRNVNITKILDGHTTFEAALRSDDSKALLIAQCLYVLIVTEMIRAQAQPGSSASVPDGVAKSASLQPVDYRDLARACEEIAHMYLELKESDYFQMLELPRSASDRDVVAAHERIVKPYLVENLLAGLPEDVIRRAREIEEMLNRAHDTLISPEERRRYVARLGDAASAGANA